MYRKHKEEKQQNSIRVVTELSNAKTIVGTCMDMCPYKERIEREVMQDLALFEMVVTPSPSPLTKKIHRNQRL